MVKCLFVLKQGFSYFYPDDSNNYSIFGSGLFNSSINVVNMLNQAGIESNLVTVIDNNYIDAAVTTYRPTHVFIEALWVVPSKFDILRPLHPNVKWIVRIHSDIPFIANESIATNWIFEYIQKPNVFVAFNSINIYEQVKALVSPALKHKIVYLPNYYEGIVKTSNMIAHIENTIDIGCFGAIRPLKNQLIQAMAAINFCNEIGKNLRFHINGTRVEQRGEAVLTNIRNLFNNFPQHQLVEHEWLEHDDFVNLVSSMHINMQISLTETFNIVTADSVINNVPVVVSDEIKWVNPIFRVRATCSKSIKNKLKQVYMHLTNPPLLFLNKKGLRKSNQEAKKTWLEFLRYNF